MLSLLFRVFTAARRSLL